MCPLPSLPDHGACPVLQHKFGNAVNSAIDRVMSEHPELFDFNDTVEGTSFKVRDRDKYLKAVADNLNKAGYCVAESKEELGVKNSNDFNEQWNVITSNLRVRRSYVTTCMPAAF